MRHMAGKRCQFSTGGRLGIYHNLTPALRRPYSTNGGSGRRHLHPFVVVQVLDFDVYVVEQIVAVGVSITVVKYAGVLWFTVGSHIASHRKSGRTDIQILLIDKTECNRHVIHNPRNENQ